MGRELIILAIAFFLVISATFDDDSGYISSDHTDRAGYFEIVRDGVGRVYPLSAVEGDGVIAGRQSIQNGDSIEYLDDGTVDVGRMSGGGLLLLGIPIDLNSSEAYDLSAVSGLGPKTAESIVKFRKESGRFQSVDELVEVRGIGKKRLSKIRPYLTI